MSTLPKIGKDKIVPEGQISQGMIRQIAPKAVSLGGTKQLIKNLRAAHDYKDAFDIKLKAAAKPIGADTSTRVKNVDVILKKIAQKKMEGRDYDANSVNDVLGGRLIVKDKDDFGDAQKAVEGMADKGEFKILKQQMINNESHHSYHFDIEKETPGGKVRGEIQILTPQELADSVVNHDIYANHAENPPPDVEKLRDTQSAIVKQLPNDEAKKLADTIVEQHKQAGDKQLPPIQIAKEIISAQNG